MLKSSGQAQEFETVLEILADGPLRLTSPMTPLLMQSVTDDPSATWTITSIEAVDISYNYLFNILDYIVITQSIIRPEAPRAPPQCILSENQTIGNNSTIVYDDAFCVFMDDGKCQACIPGFTVNEDEGTTCTACQPGFYKTSYGIDPCLPCAAGWSTVGFSGQPYCWPCPAGSSTVGKSGQGACTQCAPNSEALEEGTPSCACSLGASLDYTGHECVPCPTGTYMNNSECTPCEPGMFSAVRGGTSCLLCSPGKYAAVGGLSACFNCTMGVANSTTCTCDLGYYHSEYEPFSCIPCPLGYFQGLRGEGCQACEKGTYNSILGSSACNGCASGTFASVGGLSACVPCPINTTSSYSFSYLLLSSSRPFTITECRPCGDRTYTLQEGSLFCFCPAGTYPLDNEYRNPSSILLFLHRCEPCDAGFYQPHDETLRDNDNYTTIKCEVCEPGTYSPNRGQKSCTQCGMGKYESGWGSTNCTECGPYSTTLYPGQISKSECKCISGSTRDFRGESCVPCPIGFYQNDSDSGECLACTGYATNLAVGSTACDSCLAGSLSTEFNGSIECKPCRPGFYQPISQQTQCLQCPAGSFSNLAGSTYCSLCEQDSFASVDGSAACSPCPPYSETGGVSGSTRCACTLGSSISIYDTCIPCPAGSFQAQRGGPCQPCAAGTITPNAGSSGALACISCAQGTFAASVGLSACTQCPTLSDTRDRVGASSCTCISGTSTDYSGAQCVECIPGYYHTAPLEHCTACPGGHFSNQTRSTACIQCPQQMYSQLVTGSTACLQCEGGSIPWKNQTSCTCSEALHMFNKTDSHGNWKCADCTPSCDHSTSYQAQACNPKQDTLCKQCSLECPSGRYMSANCTATRDIVCTPCSQTCSLGYFMMSKCSETADIMCGKCTSKCPTKRFAATEACTYTHDLICSLCPPGKYVKDNVFCEDCSDGSAATSLDDTCVPCGQGFYSNPNKTMCVKQCPPNTYPSSSKGCSECPPLSGGNGMGCHHTISANNTSTYDNSSQICKPDFVFNVEEM